MLVSTLNTGYSQLQSSLPHYPVTTITPSHFNNHWSLTVPVVRAVGGVGLLQHATAAQGGRGGGSSGVDGVAAHESAVCKDKAAPAKALSVTSQVERSAYSREYRHLDPCRSPLLAVSKPWLRLHDAEQLRAAA
jgi:hypothetical protein